MAAEIDEITERNDWDIERYLQHLITDLHDALNLLRAQGLLIAKHDDMLEEFRPLLDQFRSPAASFMTRRAQQRNGNGRRT